jgi:hypothetical protein
MINKSLSFPLVFIDDVGGNLTISEATGISDQRGDGQCINGCEKGLNEERRQVEFA